MNRVRKHHFPLVAFVSIAAMAAFFWVCDDAFISFRYSKNLAEGFGLRYNRGLEPAIEGYSNLLWVLLAAIPEYFRIPPYIVMPLLSMLCGVVLLWRVKRVLEVQIGMSPENAALFCLSLGLFPPFFIWGTSGLEPMPFALSFFLVFEALFLSQSRSRYGLAALAGAALVLLRAEGFAWAMAIAAVAIVWRPGRIRTATGYLLPVLAVVGAVTLFRWAYYGALVPNTVHAKVDFSLAVAERGLFYVIVFLLTFLTPVLSLLALPLAFRSPHRGWGPPAAAFLLGFYTYAILVGGDFMSYGRFLVPSLPFQVLILGLLAEELRSRWSLGLAPAAIAVLCIGVGILPAFDTYLVPKDIRSAFHFRLNKKAFMDEHDHWRFMVRNSKRWRERGEILARTTGPGESIVAAAIGNIGYFSGLDIYDRFGLVTRLERRPKRKAALKSPGHDMRVGEGYFVRFGPTYLSPRFSRQSKLGALAERRRSIPEPYAPLVIDLEDGAAPGQADRRVLVLFKRTDNPSEYTARWEALEHRTTPDSPA